MKRILFFSFGILSGLQAAAQTYVPVSVSGFTADIVANGTGAASASTNNDVDGGSFAFVATNFVNPSGQSPASALPNNGTIQSVVAATPGLTFQLAPYTGNNSLRISGTGSGTLTLAAPTSADQVFVLATSGSGTSAVTITVNFTDGTSQTFTQTIADWFGATGFAIQGISRVNITNSSIQNSATDPRLYQYQLTLAAANVGKPIQSVAFTKTATGGVLNVMGIALRTVTSSVPNDVGITGVTAPESGCGLTAQETVTVTVHNFGMAAQSNIPVSYTLNGGTPVTEVLAGPLASNTSATYSFTATADISALGSHTFVVSTGLGSDTEAGNNSVTKTVVVSQTPAMPAISVTGPTTFCAGNWVTLSASTTTTGASYQWRLNGNPINGATGATYAAGATGDYSVVANASGCSSPVSAPVTLTSTAAPFAPMLSAGGATSFCSGESVTLTATSGTSGATYLWLRDGTSIPGATGNTYTATSGGAYRAIAMAGGCASTQSNQTIVTVLATPVTPVISQNGNTLTSSSGVGNQWYQDGTEIPGATGSTHVATANGTYTVVVTDNGCSSATSNALSVILSGVENELAGLGLSVFPNPSTGVFTVNFTSVNQAEITVFDLAGRLVHRQTLTGSGNQVQLSGIAKGLYVVQVSTELGVAFKKVVVE